MDDFVKRKDVIEAFDDPAVDRYYGDVDPDSVIRVIETIPTADVRPVVRGQWRLGGYGQISDATEKWYDKYLQGGFLYCSVCKGRTSVKFNFCPNCGADMRGNNG